MDLGSGVPSLINLPAPAVITKPGKIQDLNSISSGVFVGGNDFGFLRLKEARLPAVKGGHQVEKSRYAIGDCENRGAYSHNRL
jgi:hypothetical protein